MNYLFFYYGKIPDYVLLTLNNILNIDKNAELYLATQQKVKFKNVNIFDISETNLGDKFEEINEGFVEKNLVINPLWVTSMLRIFALKELKGYFNLDSFVHFDLDVLIYKSFEEIREKYKFPTNKVSITQNDPRNLVFGYSYFPNHNSIDGLVAKLNKNMSDIKKLQNLYSRGKEIPEMRHLGILNEMYPDMFNFLPSLPYENTELLFDPAAYGQFLNGTHLKRGNYIFKRRWVSMNHLVGHELKSKRIKFKFNSKPFVIYDKKNIELANLHIHSKNISKYLPARQINYINL